MAKDKSIEEVCEAQPEETSRVSLKEYWEAARVIGEFGFSETNYRISVTRARRANSHTIK